tara:strand:+ start:132 stop:368 length:237 start_codon:yes stop_codon:yes gene_type:complete
MARSEENYQTALQQFLNDENFEELIGRTKFQFFEEWQRTRDPKERERIFAKLEVTEELCNAIRAAADSIAFEKQKGNS